jgi:hypothetical protein
VHAIALCPEIFYELVIYYIFLFSVIELLTERPDSGYRICTAVSFGPIVFHFNVLQVMEPIHIITLVL